MHCPPHFCRVDFDLRAEEKTISDWIWENLAGRFYFGDGYVQDEQGRVQSVHRCAFESQGEATLFGLMLDQFNHR